MNFESNIPKNSSLEDFFSGVFNTSASHSFMMNNDDNMYLDENVNEFFGTSPEQDPFSSYFPFNNNNNSFYATSFPENSSPINNINETQQQITKSSSILSLTDFKPSYSRTSSSASFAGLQTPSILHNGESSPMESFHQMDEFQRQLDEDFLRNGGVASLNISSESTFKPRSSDQNLFKFNKQMDFLSGIPKPSTETNQDIFASLNDQISESLMMEEPPKDSTIDAMDTSSVNSKQTTTPGLPPGHKIINGEMYNDRGYKICGFMNQHNRPCQRIGKCPFHDRMKSDKPLSTNSDGIIAAQDSIEPEHFAPTQIVKEKKKSDKKSKKKQDETLPEIQSVESLTTTASASTSEDKPATKKPYKQGWTKEEHILFLKGLELHGKGSWKEISAIVGSRSPTQIQSHAQKYFLRQKQQKKNKRSIHDFTMDDMKKQDSVEEVEENTHKRKRNKSKSKKTGSILSEESTEPQLEVFGETLVGDANASLMKQFTLAPPQQPQQPQQQDANYIDIINKLNHLKSFPKQSSPSSKSSAFSSVSSDELDFHFNTNNESLPTVTEEHSDLYDAWEIGESTTVDDYAPFHKKIKL